MNGQTANDRGQYGRRGPTPVPYVNLNRYLGIWYEQGSVKQFFSKGLVNSKAVYTLNDDGTVHVRNTGNYATPEGHLALIDGTAAPLDATNARLNVSFWGPPKATPPGNYWIIDLDPNYRWAIVSNAKGSSVFLLSRARSVSDTFYAALLARAAYRGADTSKVTRTPQL